MEFWNNVGKRFFSEAVKFATPDYLEVIKDRELFAV
jgi:hypothetical protein